MFGIPIEGILIFIVIVVVIIYFLGGFGRSAGRGPSPDKAGKVPCPMCYELILPRAKKCPFCKSDIPQTWRKMHSG